MKNTKYRAKKDAMILIKHNLANIYAVYGLNHFLSKYGIAAKIDKNEKPHIEIVYPSSDGAEQSIMVEIPSGNGIQKDVMGYLYTGGLTIPILEVARELNEPGRVLATFHREGLAYPCVIVNGCRLIMGFDVFSEIGYILSGFLETRLKKPSDESEKMIKTPVVDMLEELLFTSLQLVCEGNGLSLEHKPFWPDGKKFAVCLTHDVDRVYKTFQYIPSILAHIRRIEPSGIIKQARNLLSRRGKDNPFWNFEEIMNLENRLGVKSTFFFLNESGKPNPFSYSSWIKFTGRYNIDSPDIIEIIKKLHSEGFEIGMHGSYNSYNDVNLLKREKAELEEILGDRVYGIRQHYLNFDLQNTFNCQVVAGFEYDSTIGFNKGTGCRRGTCFPFYPLDHNTGKELPLLEIPLIIMDVALNNRDLLGQCLEVMDEVERHKGVLTLLWHQSKLNQDDLSGLIEIYKQLIETAQSKNTWITTANDLQKWWRDRQEQIMQTAVPHGVGKCK